MSFALSLISARFLVLILIASAFRSAWKHFEAAMNRAGRTVATICDSNHCSGVSAALRRPDLGRSACPLVPTGGGKTHSAGSATRGAGRLDTSGLRQTCPHSLLSPLLESPSLSQ